MIKRLTVPIYGRRLIFADTRSDAVRALRQLKRDEEATEADFDCYGLTDEHRGTVLMFVDSEKHHPGGELATVVHESVHAAGMVLGYAGVDYGPENDEQLAYLVDWIFTQWNRRMV